MDPGSWSHLLIIHFGLPPPKHHQTPQTSRTRELIGTALLPGKGNASALLKSDTVIDDLAVPQSISVTLLRGKE